MEGGGGRDEWVLKEGVQVTHMRPVNVEKTVRDMTKIFITSDRKFRYYCLLRAGILMFTSRNPILN